MTAVNLTLQACLSFSRVIEKLSCFCCLLLSAFCPLRTRSKFRRLCSIPLLFIFFAYNLQRLLILSSSYLITWFLIRPAILSAANEPPAKRAQLVTPPKPSPLKRPPQTVPNPPPKRLELAMLREEDVVIPRITEWQFETLDDVADDGEITSATRKRPLPGTDLPARLRPIRWRNIGKDVKRGRGWKKGLEILARGWQGGRQEKEGRGEERRGEEPQERIGLGREPEDRRDRGRERGVTGDAPNVQERKESLAPESGAGRKATEGGRGDVEKREERRGSPSPREDTSSRGGKRCGVSSRAGALQRKDAAVAEHEEGKGQPKGSPRVKGGLEQNLVEMEQTPGTIEPASLTEMRPAALQSVQGFEAVPVRYRIATEATERASRFADVLYAAEAPERPPEASGRLVEASESPGEASERVSDVMALPSPGGASNTGETSGKEAPGPAEESKAPEIPTTEEPSGPNQLANETVPMNPTESAPGPKSAEASDLKSWPGPRTPLPGAESGGPVLPADESGPMSGEGGELQPLIVLPSTVPPKRKRGRPPKNKPPGELGDPLKAPARQKAPVRPKTPARLKAPVEPAQPLETMAPKRKRGRPRKVRDPPETDENPAAPPKKLPARRKKAAQLPGAPPEPANAGPPPGAIAGDGGGSPMDVDDLPLSDRVADAIKARGSIHTMGKGRDAGGVNEPAAGESSQGTHSDWLAGADEGLQGDELDEVCYGMPPEQNVCMLVFPRDRSEVSCGRGLMLLCCEGVCAVVEFAFLLFALTWFKKAVTLSQGLQSTG